MKDAYGRTIDYMRISITDRCNLRCRYCMPEGVDLVPMEHILTYEEIVQICTIAAQQGIRKLKITGGEPLVRRGCVDLIRSLKAIPGIEQVTLTTNGVLLGEYAEALKAAGVDCINVSLDTLQRDVYREITERDELPRVLESMQKALTIGLRLKINAVLQKGTNDTEWKALLELAHTNPIDVRFIEMMPIGFGTRFEPIYNEALLAQIKACYAGVREELHSRGNGPAQYILIPGFCGAIGFISAIHGKFCGSCNRIRMTAQGELKPCLCYGEMFDLREPLRREDFEAVQELLCEAIHKKPKQHCFEAPGEITEEKRMVQIGG